MKNLFNSENYASSEPTDLVAGAFWAWRRSDISAAYPPAEFSLVYRLALLAEPFSDYQLTAGKTDGEHLVEVPNADSDDYVAGEYRWRAVIVRDADGAEVPLEEGFLTVHPATAEGGDARPWTLRVLLAVRATIEGTASEEQSRIEIAGRVLERRTISELLDLEREFSKRWRGEKEEIDRKAGRTVSRRILVGMGA